MQYNAIKWHFYNIHPALRLDSGGAIAEWGDHSGSKEKEVTATWTWALVVETMSSCVLYVFENYS